MIRANRVTGRFILMRLMFGHLPLALTGRQQYKDSAITLGQMRAQLARWMSMGSSL